MKVVTVDPEIMSGVPCFTKTRVPIKTLHDFIENGDSIDKFLDEFPSVSREQVVEYLQQAREIMGYAALRTA